MAQWLRALTALPVEGLLTAANCLFEPGVVPGEICELLKGDFIFGPCVREDRIRGDVIIVELFQLEGICIE